MSVKVKKDLLASILMAKSLDGHSSRIKSYGDLRYDGKLDTCVSFFKIYHSTYLDSCSNGGTKSKFG